MYDSSTLGVRVFSFIQLSVGTHLSDTIGRHMSDTMKNCITVGHVSPICLTPQYRHLITSKLSS